MIGVGFVGARTALTTAQCVQLLSRRRFGMVSLVLAGATLAACGRSASGSAPVRGSALTASTLSSRPANSQVVTSGSPAQLGATAPAKEGASVSVPIGTTVGTRAPSWELTTVDGKKVGSADFLATKKPYILFFWATW